jgi:2-methylcitrate dehydratase PrpD
MTKYFLDRLASLCADATYEMLPDSTIYQAKRCALDLLGCALGAMALGCNRGLADYVAGLGGRREAPIWGSGTCVPSAHAALVNGSVAHHLELDDGHLEAASHPGISVVPAALAVAEMTGASGRELLRAIVLGYEVCIRSGLAVAAGIREHGVHGPGMMGPLGAAAAASILLRLPEPQIAAALATAGSVLPVSPYESFVEGTPSKDLYGGWAGFSGILATELARCGMDGPHRFVEGKRSVGQLLLHGKVRDADSLLANLGQPFLIEHIYFKPFAASRAVQPAVTGILELAEEYRFSADDVESVEVETYPFSAGLSEDSTLQTPVAARLNIPYAVAAALRRGGLGPGDFTPDALSDEGTLSLASRVKVSTAERYGAGSGGARASVVSVRLRDGRVVTTEIIYSRWDRHRPPSDDELVGKFDKLAEQVLRPDRIAQVKATIWSLETCQDLHCLPGLLAH